MKNKWLNNGLYMALAFTFCFMFRVQQVFVANAVFMVLFFVFYRKVSIDRISAISFLAFIAVVVISTLSYIGALPFGIRNLFQFGYNFQYVFLLLSFGLNNKKLDRCILLFAVIFSAWIILAYLFSGTVTEYSFSQLMIIGRTWGKDLINGWPNETVLPLLYALFLNLFTDKKSKISRVVIAVILYIALILTTSRTGILGGGLILAYYILKVTLKLPKEQKKIIFGLAGAVAVFAVVFVLANDSLRTRLFYMEDRETNMVVAFDYLRERLMFGHGGNTLDVLINNDPNPMVDRNLGHTHNTILELLVRYGVLGLASFLFMLWCSFRKIRNPDGIFALVLFWGIYLPNDHHVGGQAVFRENKGACNTD